MCEPCHNGQCGSLSEKVFSMTFSARNQYNFDFKKYLKKTKSITNEVIKSLKFIFRPQWHVEAVAERETLISNI